MPTIGILLLQPIIMPIIGILLLSYYYGILLLRYYYGYDYSCYHIIMESYYYHINSFIINLLQATKAKEAIIYIPSMIITQSTYCIDCIILVFLTRYIL